MNGKPAGVEPGNFPTMERSQVVSLARISHLISCHSSNRGPQVSVQFFKMGHDQVQSVKVAYPGINTIVFEIYALYTFPNSECWVWKLATHISLHSDFPIRKSNGKSGL